MHVNTYFLQNNRKYQDGRLNEVYQQVHQASQRPLLQQERISSGHHLKLMGVMDPAKYGHKKS